MTITPLLTDSKLAPLTPPIVYALSGGSAKGFAHVGMMSVLEELGCKPARIVGTSAGALFGALYAHYGSTQLVIGHAAAFFGTQIYATFAKRYFTNDDKDSGLLGKARALLKGGAVVSRLLTTSAAVKEEDAEELFQALFHGIDWPRLAIPFTAMATNLSTGESIPIDRSSGIPLYRAIMASTAIPYIFPAVSINGALFADGGIMANLPADEARRAGQVGAGTPYIVGFDVSAPIEPWDDDDDPSMFDIASRILSLSMRSRQLADRNRCDILMMPITKSAGWSDFSEYKTFVSLGENCARQHATSLISGLLDRVGNAISSEKGVFARPLLRHRLAKLGKSMRSVK